VEQKKDRDIKRLERGYDHDKFLSRLEEVAVFLRERGVQGIVWKSFIRKIGFEYELFMSWINRGNTPGVDGIISFCERTGISLEWLLEGLGPMLSPYTKGAYKKNTRVYLDKITAIEDAEKEDVTREDIDFLITVLEQHAYERVRKKAAFALTVHPSVRAAPTLEFAAEKDKDSAVRLQAREALERLDKEKYGPWCLEMLERKGVGVPPPRIVYMDAEDPKIVEDFRRRNDRDAFIPIRILANIQDLRVFSRDKKESTLRYALIYHGYLPPSARHQNSENEQIVCVIADDSSMAPTIPAGAVVAIDLFDKKIEAGMIYAVYNRREREAEEQHPKEDVVTLKRVRVSGQNLNFFCDNPEEKRYPRSESMEHVDALILGKALWWETMQKQKK